MSRQADLKPREKGAQTLKVVAGILHDRAGRILISERIGDTRFAGLWEFPGGKIAPGESPEAALCRELREEIGISVSDYRHFLSLEHRYSDRHVEIEFFLVDVWLNEPTACEGQGLRWCLPQDIAVDELLPADEPVLAALCAG